MHVICNLNCICEWRGPVPESRPFAATLHLDPRGPRLTSLGRNYSLHLCKLADVWQKTCRREECRNCEFKICVFIESCAQLLKLNDIPVLSFRRHRRSSFKFSWSGLGSKRRLCENRVGNMPFKVIEGRWFQYQSKACMEFLFVINSYLDRILPRFRDCSEVLVTKSLCSTTVE